MAYQSVNPYDGTVVMTFEPLTDQQLEDVVERHPADRTIGRIGDLLNYGLPALLEAARTKDTR